MSADCAHDGRAGKSVDGAGERTDCTTLPGFVVERPEKLYKFPSLRGLCRAVVHGATIVREQRNDSHKNAILMWKQAMIEIEPYGHPQRTQ